MLQQTRVAAVLKYFEPFIDRFPSFHALAQASRDDVMLMWEGLGYYRRAHHLHQSARQMQSATTPTTSAQLLKYPGLGRYASAAVASIVFGEAAAAVDANVVRVISRIFNLPVSKKVAASKKIAHWAKLLLSRERPGDFNQAWMDLGSSLCLPRSPQCPTCPLRQNCLGRIRGSLPSRNRIGRVAKPIVVAVTLVAMTRDKVLVRRRPDHGRWSGLWEFPTIELKPCTPPSDSETAADVTGAVRTLIDELGLSAFLFHPIGVTHHELTHLRYQFHTFRASKTAAQPALGAIWIRRDALHTRPMSTAHRTIQRSAFASLDDA